MPISSGGSGAPLGNAVGKITIDASGVKSGVSQALSALGQLQAVAVTVGAALGVALVAGTAAAGAALGALGIKAIQAGSDVEEMLGKYSVVFGQFSGEVGAQLTTLAGEVGRNRYELMGFASTFQDTFVPLGFARGEAADLSVALTQLTVDMGSFNNVAEPQVLMDLQSAIVGNHETMRKYGVIITETTLGQELMRMGIAGGTAAASEQEKVMARLNIIYAGTTDAQGDAIRTAASFANQMRALKSSVQETVQGIGLGLLPLATQFIGAFRAIEPALSRILAGVFAILRNIVEVGIEFVRSLGSALGINFDSLAGDAETWGSNIVTMLANGMAAAASAVISVLNELGQMIAYWLAPGSPPRLLPDLPDWGASAMTEFMNGWSSGDFSVFDQVKGTVEGLVRSLGEGLPEVDLINMIIGSRDAVAQAIEQMRTVGSVSKATMDAIVAGAGPAADAVRAYITATLESEGAMNALRRAQAQLQSVQDITLENYRQFSATLTGRVSPAVQAHLASLRQLEQANNAYEQAQTRLNAVTTKYDNILGPLNDQLRALRDQQTTAAEDDQLTRLNEDINSGWLTGAELREAIAQRDAILLQRRIREVEAQRDAEVGAAEDAVESAEEAQQSAEEKAEATKQAAIDVAKAEAEAAQRKVDALDEQIARNQAIIDQIQEEIRLQGELAKAIEDAAKALEDAAAGGGSGGSGGGGPKVGGAGGPKIPTLGGAAASAMGDISGLMEGKFADIFANVGNIFQPIKDQAAELGETWAGVVEGLKTKWDGFKGSLTGFASGFSLGNLQAKFQPFLDGIAPLKPAFENVVNTIREKVVLFAQFIGEQVAKIKNWAAENEGLITNFLGVVGTIIGVIVTVVSFVYTNLTGLFDVVLVILDGVITQILNFVTLIMQVATGDWAAAWETIKTILATALDNAKNLLIALVNWVAEWFGSSWEEVKTTWEGLWDQIGEILSLAWEAIKTSLSEAWLAIKTFVDEQIVAFTTGWTAFWDGLKLTVETIWEAVKTFINTKLQEAFAAMGLDLDTMKARWETIWNDVKLIAETVWGLIKEAVLTKVTEVKTDIETVVNGVKTWWSTTWTEIKTKAETVWADIKTAITTKVNEVKTNIETKVNEIKAWWGPIWGEIKTKVTEIWGEIKTAVETKLGEVKTAIETKINEAKSWIGDQVGGFKSVGESIITGLKDGVIAMAGTLINAITGAIEDALAAARALLGIASPSKVFMQMGVFAGEGLAMGINNSASLAVDSAKKMANAVIGAMRPLASAMSLDKPLIALDTFKKFAADTTTVMAQAKRRVFDMVNWEAMTAAANNYTLAPSYKPAFSTASYPTDRDNAVAAETGKKETHLHMGQLVLPNVTNAEELLRDLTDYQSAYGNY